MPEFLIYLFVCLLIFAVCRELTCWYFKLSDILKELKVITAELRVLRSSPTSAPTAPEPVLALSLDRT